MCYTPYYHVLDFIRKMLGNQLKVYVEIGVLFGGSMALMMQQNSNGTYVGIDLFDGYYSKQNPGSLNRDPICGIPIDISIAKHNIDIWNKYDQKYYLIAGDSISDKTIDNLDKILENRPIDLLMIDGDHSYEGVKKDFELYHKKVRVGGIIIFDNYSEHHWTDVKKYIDSTNFEDYGYQIKLIYGVASHEDVGACVIAERFK